MPSMNLARGTIGGRADAFKVLKVRGSTTYSPGQILCKDEVDDLIHTLRWQIEVVEYKPNDYYVSLEKRIEALERRIGK